MCGLTGLLKAALMLMLGSWLSRVLWILMRYVDLAADSKWMFSAAAITVEHSGMRKLALCWFLVIVSVAGEMRRPRGR